MEQNVQVMSIKSAWHIVRVAFFMIRKNITKRKLLLDLKYLSLKRSKLAGKLSHRHHHHDHPFGGAYDNKNTEHHVPTFGDTGSEVDAVNRILEMIVAGPTTRNDDMEGYYSPVFNGFGSPRETDYPCSWYGCREEEVGNYGVDQDAEEFIQRFYTQLNQQRITDV